MEGKEHDNPTATVAAATATTAEQRRSAACRYSGILKHTHIYIYMYIYIHEFKVTKSNSFALQLGKQTVFKKKWKKTKQTYKRIEYLYQLFCARLSKEVTEQITKTTRR